MTLGALATGTVLSWTSPAEEPIMAGELGFEVTAGQFSWVGALVALGAATVCYPIAIIMNMFGRKITMLGLIIPFTIGWLLLYFASNVAMLMIGRYLVGIAGGAFCVSAPLYTSEIASNEIRGMLGTYFQLLVTVGIFFVNVLGSFLSLSWITLVLLCVPFVFGIVFFFQPETPVYLIKAGKINEARESLTYFRGGNNTNYNVEEELQDLITANSGPEPSAQEMVEVLKTKAGWKSVTISCSLMLFQQFSGINAVIFYAAGIFDSADVGIKSIYCVIIVMAIQVIATFIGSLIIEKLGRKILLLSSAAMMAVCALALGIYFSLQESWSEEDIKSIAFLPIVALSVFVIMFSIGFGPIPWMIVGEITPPEIKSVVISAACTFNWLLAFLVTKFYGTLSDPEVLGQAVTFYMFSAVSALGTVFVFTMVLETKGKTLQEIQDELNGTKSGVVYDSTRTGHDNYGYK